MPQFNFPIISSNSEYKNVASNVVYFEISTKTATECCFYIFFLHFQRFVKLLPFAQNRYEQLTDVLFSVLRLINIS